MPAMDASSLRWMAVTAQFDGVGLDDAERALEIAYARAATVMERRDILLGMHSVALNRGRVPESLRASRRLVSLDAQSSEGQRLMVLDALYAGGDSTAAASAARILGSWRAPSTANDSARAAASAAICVAAQWRLAQGDTAAIAGTAAMLAREVRIGNAPSEADDTHACALLLAAAADVRRRDAGAAASVEALDRYLLEGRSLHHMAFYAPLAAARLHEALGDRPGALAAVRRRGYFGRWPQYLAPHLATEARLAAAVGDTAGARMVRWRLGLLRGGAPGGP
jgi:hypothetical protein